VKKAWCVFTIIALIAVGGYCQQAKQTISAQKQVLIKKPVYLILARIQKIQPLYDDCQLNFYIKGKYFGNTAAKRVVQLNYKGLVVTPQILSWSMNQIECRLKGDFKLGLDYRVYLKNSVNNTLASNKIVWRVLTRLTLKSQKYKVGQKIACGGCLLGATQGTRSLVVGNVNAQITDWCCEDIVFIVPNLPAGTYPLVLKDGNRILSNTLQIDIF
jgi:hypothetical protein